MEDIERAVTAFSKTDKVKIALCHHHPMQQCDYDDKYTSNDLIDRGTKLLDHLKGANFNILIHGHKHFPRLRYHSKTFPVFCYGSFSSFENVTHFGADNNAHFLTIIIDNSGHCYGKITTWSYNASSGWYKTDNSRAFFPSQTGFGFDGDVTALVDIIMEKYKDWYANEDKVILNFIDILSDFPEIEYLTPDEQQLFCDRFQTQYRIEVQPSLKQGAKRLLKIEE